MRVVGEDTVPVNILVVDDRAENRLALKAILTAPDYRIFDAADEGQALRELLRRDFALILMDVVMPGMDGFELTRLIKERERMASVPVIFLTAEAADAAFVERAYAVGAADYLIKPLQPKMVRTKIEVFAELYRQRRRLERQSKLLLQAERRHGEERYAELRQASERRYRDLAEAVPHIVWTAQADGSVDYFNRRWYEYTGRSASESTGSWLGAVHPEDRESCGEAWRQAVETGAAFETVCRLRRPDGQFRWQLCRAVPERSATGRLLSWRGTFTDVDEQKRIESTLAEFKNMLDGMLNAVMIFCPQTDTLVYANIGSGELFNYPVDELMALRPAEVLPYLGQTDMPAVLRDSADRKVLVETIGRRKDGEEVPVELFLQLVEGGSEHIIAVARDITQRKQSEASREELYQKALNEVQARDEFLSVASHELRTPLTSLSLQVELLERELMGGGGAPSAQAAEILRRQIGRLVRLIEELLDISRIDSGQFQVTPQPLNLATLVREVVERYAEDAAKAGCSVSIEAPEELWGEWDLVRLEQVVTNLVTNALKFGSGKPVEVSVSEEAGRASLTVRDHGVGMSDEIQARVFERFARAKATAAAPGLGLGLYITKQIVDAHGGAITVRSAPGEGAAFKVLLPRQEPARSTEAAGLAVASAS